MTNREYTVTVHREEDETYWAEVSELPGCFASGESLDELSEALEESIALYLSDDDSGSTVASTTVGKLTVGEMRVTVAA